MPHDTIVASPMLQTVPDVLTRIVEQKRAELAASGTITADLELRAHQAAQARRPFRKSLEANTPAVISEIKKASPSKGLLTHDFSPARIATQYQQGGAAALSVLTDQKFFQGSLADLAEARTAVALPVLRKDFTISEFHIVEAAASGADAILLIAAILTTVEMRRFRELAATFHLDVLVEVHDGEELSRALDSGAEILGVNNRNLHNFEVTLQTSLDLIQRIPQSLLKVSESGIHSHADLHLLHQAGYQAFLVGEHLMKSPDPAHALRSLRGC